MTVVGVYDEVQIRVAVIGQLERIAAGELVGLGPRPIDQRGEFLIVGVDTLVDRAKVVDEIDRQAGRRISLSECKVECPLCFSPSAVRVASLVIEKKYR
jgi:hypothetical protein